MSNIEPLKPEYLNRAATTLTRAFSSDPMFTWVFPDPDHRRRSLQLLNRVPLSYGMHYGSVTQSSDGRAVAVWIPPGRAVSLGGMIRSGMLNVPFRVGLRAFGRFIRANDVMGKIHTRQVPEPHWYLLIVGVDPELQGRGLGSRLVLDGLSRADKSNFPCYLETSEERNVPFYERFGFTVIAKVPLGTDGPPAWAMRRAG